MKFLRVLLIFVYVGYLVQVGLLLTLLPWSQAWGTLVSSVPPWAMGPLDQPFVRGLISGFGALHLLLLSAELVNRPDAQRGPS